MLEPMDEVRRLVSFLFKNFSSHAATVYVINKLPTDVLGGHSAYELLNKVSQSTDVQYIHTSFLISVISPKALECVFIGQSRKSTGVMTSGPGE